MDRGLRGDITSEAGMRKVVLIHMAGGSTDCWGTTSKKDNWQ